MATPRDSAIAALELREPDGLVPTFELEFQLTEELLGKSFAPYWEYQGDERQRAVSQNAELHMEVAATLDYSIIRTGGIEEMQRLTELGAGKQWLLCGESDGTMAIPDGDTMEQLTEDLFERPEEVHERLSKSNAAAMERAAKLAEAGAELMTMCADYCFNQAPFLSPRLFSEFVTPYLAEAVAYYRSLGLYVIKHTDGNIMPILDQIVDAQPHGIHSLDPQAGIDLAEIKRRVGSRVCLCGNVNCALMQTGTDDEVRQSAIYALEHGMPGGGYIYCTSNVAFKGLPLERYLMILDVRKQFGGYRRTQ